MTDDRAPPAEEAAPADPAEGAVAPEPDVALDEDAPGEIEKTFAILMALAGTLCLVPRQWVPAGILYAASIAVTVLYFVRKRRRGT